MRRLLFLSLACLLTFGSVLSPVGVVNGMSNSKMEMAGMVKPSLEFTLVNHTGYTIKGLYMAPASSEEWDKEDELLHGRSFPNDSALVITFNPKVNADKFDIMVVWADGSPNSVWDNIDLKGASKLTMTYDRPSDTTTINRE
jgi:hypothetical protein